MKASLKKILTVCLALTAVISCFAGSLPASAAENLELSLYGDTAGYALLQDPQKAAVYGDRLYVVDVREGAEGAGYVLLVFSRSTSTLTAWAELDFSPARMAAAEAGLYLLEELTPDSGEEYATYISLSGDSGSVEGIFFLPNGTGDLGDPVPLSFEAGGIELEFGNREIQRVTDLYVRNGDLFLLGRVAWASGATTYHLIRTSFSGNASLTFVDAEVSSVQLGRDQMSSPPQYFQLNADNSFYYNLGPNLYRYTAGPAGEIGGGSAVQLTLSMEFSSFAFLEDRTLLLFSENALTAYFPNDNGEYASSGAATLSGDNTAEVYAPGAIGQISGFCLWDGVIYLTDGGTGAVLSYTFDSETAAFTESSFTLCSARAGGLYAPSSMTSAEISTDGFLTSSFSTLIADNGRVFALTESGAQPYLTERNENGDPVLEYGAEKALTLEGLSALALDGNGDLFLVLNGELFCWDEQTYAPRSLGLSPVTALTAAEDGGVLAVSGGFLYRVEADGARTRQDLPDAEGQALSLTGLLALSASPRDGLLHLLFADRLLCYADGALRWSVSGSFGGSVGLFTDFAGTAFFTDGSTLWTADRLGTLTARTLSFEFTGTDPSVDGLTAHPGTGTLLFSSSSHHTLFEADGSVRASVAADCPPLPERETDLTAEEIPFLTAARVTGYPSNLVYPNGEGEILRLPVGTDVLVLEYFVDDAAPLCSGLYALVVAGTQTGWVLTRDLEELPSSPLSATLEVLHDGTEFYSLPSAAQGEDGSFFLLDTLQKGESVTVSEDLGEINGIRFVRAECGGVSGFVSYHALAQPVDDGSEVSEYVVLRGDVNRDVPLYARADESAETVASLPSGTRAKVLERSEDEAWLYVEATVDGQTYLGYVRALNAVRDGLTGSQKTGIILSVSLVLLGVIAVLVRRRIIR